MPNDRIVPELCVHDAAAAIEFYKKAFGAREHGRMMSPDGRKILHCHLEILGHKVVVFDEFSASDGGTLRCPRTLGGTGARFILQVADADAAAAQAVAAGATLMMPVTKMFWGARYGKVQDPYGHEWGINEQQEELSTAEEDRRAKEYFGGSPDAG